VIRYSTLQRAECTVTITIPLTRRTQFTGLQLRQSHKRCRCFLEVTPDITAIYTGELSIVILLSEPAE